MEPFNDKEMKTAQSGRRKFLVRAGLGSLPVLLSLKSKAAWGSSTLNCSLSETASQMQSVQPDKYNECVGGFNSHGSAKLYFDAPNSKAGDGKGNYFLKAEKVSKASKTIVSSWNKTWGGVEIHQDTKFNVIFGYGYSGTLKDAVNQEGGYALIRNIAAIFLHALYYQMEGISTNIPSPDAIVAAYQGAVTTAQKEQLAALLVLYIDGQV